jgi:hypothetical protein
MTRNYSSVERWWIPSVVVAVVIGIANLIFCHWKINGGWYKKRKDEGGEGIAYNGSRKVLEVRRII